MLKQWFSNPTSVTILTNLRPFKKKRNSDSCKYHSMHWGVSAATAIVCTNLVHSAFNGIIWLYRFGSPASRTCLQQCLVTLDKFDTLKVVQLWLKAKHHPLETGLRRVVYPFIIHLGRSRSLGAAACIFSCIRLYGFGPTQCGELSCLIESQSLHWHRRTDASSMFFFLVVVLEHMERNYLNVADHPRNRVAVKRNYFFHVIEFRFLLGSKTSFKANVS